MYCSQFFEDQFLNKNIFKNKKNGIYIELGRLDGSLYSNTKFFQDKLYWNGILIEPDPEKFKLLKFNRPNNFLFNNLATCYKELSELRYFGDGRSAVYPVENSFPQKYFINYFDNEKNNYFFSQNKILIKPKTLTEIVNETKLPHIDLLSLNVEGNEYEVLTSWDFSIPIDIILIKLLGSNPEKDNMCRDLLIKNNYKFLTKFNLNEIYAINTYNLN
jgi:FkbM family methyltransferase